MGTLGKYLSEAREAREIDLRDAAQQTRINIYYLKALEAEDFSRLPGEVFVKGFLKNYSKFLNLDESEVMKRYGELRPRQGSSGSGPSVDQEQAEVAGEQKTAQKTAIEPFIWAAGIVILLLLFFFTALPARHPQQTQPAAILSQGSQTVPAPALAPLKPDKLYLEVVALEDTWLLVRTDTSPQKKAVLKKGESLLWSADERFQLSYAGAGALKLSLNGKELTVNEPKNIVVRDLIITATGIVNRNIQPEYARPRRQPAASPQQARTPEQRPATQQQQIKPSEQKPAPEPRRTQEAVPQPKEPIASPQAKPAAVESQQTRTTAQ